MNNKVVELIQPKHLKEFPIDIKEYDVVLIELPAKEQAGKVQLRLSQSDIKDIQTGSKQDIPFMVAHAGSDVHRYKRGDLVFVGTRTDGFKVRLTNSEYFWEIPCLFHFESVLTKIKTDSDLYKFWVNHFNDAADRILSITSEKTTAPNDFTITGGTSKINA